MFLFILLLQYLGSFSTNPRSVNAETSYLSRSNDVQKHNLVVHNIKSLLRSLEKHFTVDKPIFRSQNVDGVLTNFFINLGKKFVEQRDDYIKNFTITLTKVLEEYYFLKKVTPIFGDDLALQTYVVNNSLNKWHLLSGQDIRNNIQDALDTDDTVFHKIIQTVDRFFNESDKKHLDEIAADINGENGNRKDLREVIKQAVNFIIIDKFQSLDDNTKQLLQNGIMRLLYSYNKLDDFDDALNRYGKLKAGKEKTPVTEDNHKKGTIEKKEEIHHVFKETKDDIQRIKKEHLHEEKKESKSVTKLMNEHIVLHSLRKK